MGTSGPGQEKGCYWLGCRAPHPDRRLAGDLFVAGQSVLGLSQFGGCPSEVPVLQPFFPRGECRPAEPRPGGKQALGPEILAFWGPRPPKLGYYNITREGHFVAPKGAKPCDTDQEEGISWGACALPRQE